MKVRFLPFAFLALICLSTMGLQAQDAMDNPLEPTQVGKPIYVGPTAGFNRSIHTVDLPSFVEDPICPFFPNGTANGFWGGITFEYLLGKVKDSKSSIIVRAIYNSFPAYFEKEGDEHPSLVTNLDGEQDIIFSKTRHAVNVTYSTATIEACYKLNLFNSTFGFTVGPVVDFTVSANKEQTYELLKPLEIQFIPNEELIATKGYRYENNNRKIIVEDGTLDEASGMRLGIKIGAQYEILMGRWYIVPVVYYNYGINKLEAENNWYVHAIQMGVDVRFAL